MSKRVTPAPRAPKVRVATYKRGIRQPGEWGVYIDGWIVGGPLSDKPEAIHSAEVIRAALSLARKSPSSRRRGSK